MKIDEAMAVQAAREGTKIGVVATVPTTLEPTSHLISAKASEIWRTVIIEQRLGNAADAVWVVDPWRRVRHGAAGHARFVRDSDGNARSSTALTDVPLSQML